MQTTKQRSVSLLKTLRQTVGKIYTFSCFNILSLTLQSSKTQLTVTFRFGNLSEIFTTSETGKSFDSPEETPTRRRMMYVTMIRNLFGERLASCSNGVRYQTVSRISSTSSGDDAPAAPRKEEARGRSARRWQTIISQRRRILFTMCR